MKSLIVIGGGAAGMMGALCAAMNGASVTLIEKNEKLGKKLYITGKGRCNLTNACETEDFFKNIVTNQRFMYSSVYGFDQQAVMELFEQLGLKLKTERGARVFPESDKSSDVIKALEKGLKANGVKILLNTAVRSVNISDDDPQNKHFEGVTLNDGEGTELHANACFVATGGLSYPSTGSTGDGYRFGKDAGHRVIETFPSLVGLKTVEDHPMRMEGLSLKNVVLSAHFNGKCIYKEMGELLFTHNGVSGPLVLTLSALFTKQLGSGNTRLFIDLKPALDEKTLDARILKDFAEIPNKMFANSLDRLLPSSMIPVIVELSGIDPEKRVNSITKQERKKLLDLIKAFPLTVSGIGGYNEAVITKGGIDVKQIDPATMESKLVKGLYFIGEVLDVDALTGGFNLQIAWSTAHAAALGVTGV
ncbi:MAG: NAD(P)/FAD-dependent oxidoreductase [Lachnospiraceae bacterium]|nr:NAD(P)/FAD-dependent oxidoreductase [Lachnospiraceae bacterium]